MVIYNMGALERYEEAIEYGFKIYVKETFNKEEIRNFLLNHERLPKLISNLSRQLKLCENQITHQKRSQVDKRKLVKDLITDFSRTFCSAAIDEIAKRRGLDGKKEKTFEEENIIIEE